MSPGAEWETTIEPTQVTVVAGVKAQAKVVNSYRMGSLNVTKNVNWGGRAPDTSQTFQICIQGPSYPGGTCKAVGYQGGTLSWTGLQPGSYDVIESNPGSQWAVQIQG